MMFASPPTQTLEWSDAGVEGAFRFLKRLWRQVYLHVQSGMLAQENSSLQHSLPDGLKSLRCQLHQTIVKVTDDLERRHTFNTAIAAVMELINELAKLPENDLSARKLMQESLEVVLLLLSPIVPHICHTLWRELRPDTELLDQPWPQADEQALVQDEVTLVVQVNGKLRSRIQVAREADRTTIEHAAMADEPVQKMIVGQSIKK